MSHPHLTRRLAGITALALLAAACRPVRQAPDAALHRADTAFVAAMYRRTGSGGPGRDAIQLALDTWNAERPAGAPVVAMVEPGVYEPLTVALARWQSDPRIVGVIAITPAEDAVVAISQIRSELAHDRVPTPMVLAAGAPAQISGISPWVFRLSPTAQALARAQFEYVVDSLRASRFAVLYAADVFGREVLDDMLAQAAARRVVVTDIVAYDELEHDNVLAARVLARSRPEVVCLFSGNSPIVGAFARQLFRLDPSATLLGAPAHTSLSDDAMFATTPIASDFHAFAPRSPRAERFVAAYRARTQQAPAVHAARAHDAALLVAQATARGGADRATVRAGIARGLPPTLPGALVPGPLQFDARNDAVLSVAVRAPTRRAER